MPSRTEEVATDILEEPTPVAKKTEPAAVKPVTAPAPVKTRRVKTVPHRVESFETVRPDGVRVRVRRDIDNGMQTIEIV